MIKIPFLKIGLSLIIGLLSFSTIVSAEKKVEKETVKEVLNEYQDWRLISVSHRTDKKTLRAILGNDTAITFARKGEKKAWTDGSVIAKIIWKERAHPNWATAIVPDITEAHKAEAMIKDSKLYAKTGGWGFGHWVDGKLKMHPKKKSDTCFACHQMVKDNDYVFTFSGIKNK